MLKFILICVLGLHIMFLMSCGNSNNEPLKAKNVDTAYSNSNGDLNKENPDDDSDAVELKDREDIKAKYQMYVSMANREKGIPIELFPCMIQFLDHFPEWQNAKPVRNNTIDASEALQMRIKSIRTYIRYLEERIYNKKYTWTKRSFEVACPNSEASKQGLIDIESGAKLPSSRQEAEKALIEMEKSLADAMSYVHNP